MREEKIYNPQTEAKNAAEWRNWLLDNHKQENNVWLIIYRKESEVESVYYDEAVDEALCFGWIDSKPNKKDDKSFYQYFSKRNPKSNWSRVNKNKIKRLLKTNKMEKAGLEMIELAKKTGTWNALDDVENLILPKEMKELFDKKENKEAKENFENFPRYTKRGILEWIFNAKTLSTKLKRIKETLEAAREDKRVK